MKTNSIRISRIASCVLIAFTIAFTIGCGGGAVVDISKSRLGVLAQCFDQYRTRNRGDAPKSIDDLRDYADRMLDIAGVGSFDELQTSERDGQALVLKFGRDIIETDDGGEIIGYEAQGKDGKRLVAYVGGIIKELDEAAFLELVPSP